MSEDKSDAQELTEAGAGIFLAVIMVIWALSYFF